MRDGPIGTKIVQFSIPLFLTYLIQLLYHTTDTLIVGRFLGTDPQAAVGAGGNLITLMIGLLGGLTIGVSVLVARYYGADDEKGMHRLTTAALMLAAFLSVLFSLLGVVLAPTYLRLVHTPEHLLPMASAYLRVYCLSLPAMVLYNLGLGMLRGIGDSFRPMLFQIAGGLLNVLFDIVFLIFLRMEAVGAAIGTLLAQSLVALFVLCYLLAPRDRFVVKRYSWPTISFELRQILSIGAPAGFQAMLITLSNVLISAQINRLGAVAIAAFSVYFEVELLIWYPIVSFGQAAAVFVGQNAGAAQWNRLRKGVGVTNGMGVLFTVFISVFCILLAPHLFGLFSKDPEVIAFGASIVRITFPFYFVYVFLQVFGDALRSLSHSFAVMLTVLLNIGLLRVVLMYVLLHVYGTVEALVVVYPITWFTAAVSMAVLYDIKTKKSKKGEDTYETQIA